MRFPSAVASRRRLLARAGGLLLAAASCGSVRAALPDRPIRLVVPFPAGGTVDRIARMLATGMGASLGTNVIVENVPGAGGTLATTRVAKATPDGLTLLFTTPNHTINPAVIANLPFDTTRDFAPVSLVCQIPELLVANAAQPFGDFAAFVEHVRRHPGELAHASAGNGTLPHVTMELLLQRLGLSMIHVPYKGAAPAMNDLLGGQVAIKMDTIATSSQHIRSGRLKPLAIASLARSPLLPDVPTIAESGVPGYTGILWMGVLAPAGTPADTVELLNRTLTKVVTDAQLRQRLEAEGVEIVAGSPSAFASQIATELAQWAQVVAKAGIKAN
ncbi:MAG: tripartite tricarboxylate transporter substrate binding protein [Lautropia sp.]